LLVAATQVTAALPANQRLNSFWEQASAVFAQMGLTGEHASQQPTPRLGLANLARALYEAGVSSEPSLAALGGFVVEEIGLDIDACR
jgi:hypothetical protein